MTMPKSIQPVKYPDSAILTYGDLKAARRYYLHAPSGAAITEARQNDPTHWRNFADCMADRPRKAGSGGLGIGFVHSGEGEGGGEIAFIDCGYKPAGGDTPDKREWFAAMVKEFLAMLDNPSAPLGVSRSGRGRHIVARTLEFEGPLWAKELSALGKNEISCELDNTPIRNDKREASETKNGVKIEWWDWQSVRGRPRFLTGRWR